MSGFWGNLFYWVILLILLAILFGFWVVLQDIRNKYRVVRAPGRTATDSAEPFCSAVEVELRGAPVVSPLLQSPCFHYSSSIIKHYTRKRRDIFLEASAQADYVLRLGDLRFLPPDHETTTYIQPQYYFHKKWLVRSLPEKLEQNLRCLDLDEDFWKGQRSTTIDCAESVLPIKNKLWVYGCLKPDTPEGDILRLVGAAEGHQPIVAVSHEVLKHWSRYALISHVSAMIGFVIFIVVTAYVLR